MYKSHSFWKQQRLSALVLLMLLPLIPFFMMSQNVPLAFRSAQRVFAYPLPVLLFGATLSLALYHARLGTQVVLEDYVPSLKLRSLYVFLLNAVSWGLYGILFISLLRLYLNH